MKTEPLSPFGKMSDSITGSEIQVEKTIGFISEVNLSAIDNQRHSMPIKISYTAFFVKALACALNEFQYANRRVYRRWFWPFSLRVQKFIHSDIVVAVERFIPDEPAAVFTDIVRDADRATLEEIQIRLTALAQSTPETNQQWADFRRVVLNFPHWLGVILVQLPLWLPSLYSKYRGGSAIISSPSKYGVDILVGWWNYPLGVSYGLVEKRVKVVNDEIVIVPTSFVTLNWDRRIMAGAQAAMFFGRFVELLENPQLIPAATDSLAKPRPELQTRFFLWRLVERIFRVGKRA